MSYFTVTCQHQQPQKCLSGEVMLIKDNITDSDRGIQSQRCFFTFLP